MTDFPLVPYLQLPGTTRAALTFYAEIFGGTTNLYTYADFGRDDGPAENIAHGELRGDVQISAADAAGSEPVFSATGLLFALLGTGSPEQSHRWFDALAEGGEVISPLEKRQWNDYDGQVRDKFGLTWLIGYQPEE